jgi:hypothetical protein
MAIRVARPTVTLASILCFSFGQFALAQNTGTAPGAGSGNTSGPAVGTDVQPSTAIQKDQTGRSSTGGGAPGVEGKPGSESGPLPQDRPSQPPK